MESDSSEYLFKDLKMPPEGVLGTTIIELDRDYFPIPWSKSAWLEGLGKDYLLIGCLLEPPDLNKEVEEKGKSDYLNYDLVGFCLFRTLDGDTQAHLLKILVDPDYRGRKLGLRMLRLAKEKLISLGYEEIFLEVKGSNEAAIALYKKEGFQIVHKVAGYYGEKGDGVMMLCAL